jgi:methionine-rich copper-binding protein CopC
MCITKCLTASTLLLLTTTAQAHAHLIDSNPHEGSSGKAPEHIVLTFSESARVTALTLQRAGAEPQKLTPLPTTVGATVTFPLPKLSPGRYTLTWRVIADDGHISSGDLHFTVVEPPADGSGTARGDAG